MKHILLATTALVVSAGIATADISWSGKGGAGSFSGKDADGETQSEIWSGIDVEFSASTTTDGGITFSIGEDIGGGKIADYADKELDVQGGAPGTPTLTVSSSLGSITLEENGIDDLYDDDQSGDIGITGAMGPFSVGIVYDSDPQDDDDGNKSPTMSYSLSGSVGDVSVTIVGTDANDTGVSAFEASLSYSTGDMTLGLSSDNVDGEATTEGSISYAMGDISVDIAADSDDGWDAGLTYASGPMSMSYATDNDEEWELDVSYSLGGGVTAQAAADHNDTFIAGVTFSF